MNVIVIGAGRIGLYIIQDVLQWADQVVVCDQSKKALQSLPDHWNLQKELRTLDEIDPVLASSDLAISCIPYRYNRILTEKCISTRTSMVDLGGATDIVLEQLSMSDQAREAGITVIPDCGLSPGITNVLAGKLARDGYTDEIQIRVGGIPENPSGPWNYELVFSIEGLVQEYCSPVYVLEDGMIQKRDPLTELESFSVEKYTGKTEVDFHSSGALEAFLTSGGASTLPHTFAGSVNRLTDKSIRYAGHREKLQRLREETGEKEFSRILETELDQGENDLVILLVEGRNDQERKGYFLIQEHTLNWTAMASTTGSGAAAIARMIAGNEITQVGVRKQETVVDSDQFLSHLNERGISIQSYTT